MKLLNKTLLLLCLIIFSCTTNNNDITNKPITGNYCLNFALIGSELIIEKSNSLYIAKLKVNGEIISEGNGNITNKSLNLNGTINTEQGQTNFNSQITFYEELDSLSGIFNVLSPQNNIILKSSINGKKSDCNFGLSPNDVEQIKGQEILTSLHVELEKIKKISKFRSAAGHNFVDYSGESCVSLKHYFETFSGINPTSLQNPISFYSPVDGKIINMQQANFSVNPSDYEIDIKPFTNSSIILRLFHVKPKQNLFVGDVVSSGELIGTNPSNDSTSSDFAVYVLTNQGYRLISMFEIMNNNVLQEYNLRGVSTNWKNDLYYSVDNPYVSEIFCENQSSGKLRHPLSDWQLDFFNLQ